jgi:hypothetical protein
LIYINKGSIKKNNIFSVNKNFIERGVNTNGL